MHAGKVDTDALKGWFNSFFRHNPFPHSIVEWDHFDRPTRQIFIRYVGDFDHDKWMDLQNHIRARFPHVLIGVIKN